MLLDKTGAVLGDAESSDGIGTLSGGHEAVFQRVVATWPKTPAIMAGMVGSRQGWREAAYLACPVSPAALAAKILRFDTVDGRPMAIVPGLMVRFPEHGGDVMRGEETQIVGLVQREPGFTGTAILPGTHSKWVRIESGVIVDFQTFLTGELFELLSRYSFLRHSVSGSTDELSGLPDFELGVRRTAVESAPFLAAIFAVRARQLLDGVEPTDNLAYLSGLIIGGEIAAARAGGRLGSRGQVRIVGSRSLARAYRNALSIAGHASQTLDGGELVRLGLFSLALSSGFLS
jgi:2-dehydro-3-deoxygalactonokinase